MNLFIKFFLILTLAVSGAYSYAQTTVATLLPNAKQAFLDNAGNPLAGGTVTFYIPNTTTLKTTWQNSTKTILNTNPVILDSGGRAIIYGDGVYRQVVKDRLGNIIWDQLTSTTASSGGGGVSTDANPVGTVLVWSGFTPPTNYAFAYGQELTRLGFPTFFNTVTQLSNTTCSLGSPVLSNILDTSQIPEGAKIESSCAPTGSFVVSKTVNSVTINAPALGTLSSTVRFFPYGNGDGLTTFNAPDYRGRVLAGRDNMGNSPANRLTPPFFPNAQAIGTVGGTQAISLQPFHVPPFTPIITITDPGHAHTITAGSSTPGVSGVIVPGSATTTINSNTAFTGITATSTGNGGLSTAFSLVQPTITTNFIVKVISSN